jgi:hypothetical protein
MFKLIRKLLLSAMNLDVRRVAGLDSGGKNFPARTSGLWVVSDSQYFNHEQHRGVAFVQVPATAISRGHLNNAGKINTL